MKKSNRIMITGSRGFIGSALKKKLDNPTEFDIAIDRRMSILNKEALSGFIDENQPNVIIHLAANPLPSKSVEDTIYDMTLNIGGTLNLLEVCKKKELDLLLFTSTAAVYGKPDYLPIDDAHPKHPTSPYGISKLACEGYCNFYRRKYNVPITIARFFNIYGIGQPLGLVIPDIVKKIVENKDGTIKLNGVKEDARDFLYLDDLTEALIKIIQKKLVGYEINFAGDENIRIIDLAKKLAIILKKDIKFEYANMGLSASQLYGDISTTKKLLDWSPSTPFDVGLKKVVANILK